MSLYMRRAAKVEAYRVTSYNIDHLASWCGGAVKGTKLPPEQREIELICRSDEQRAKVGDWIVKEWGFEIMTDQRFQAIYVEVAEC
jgi:hypothetical protein